VWLEYLLSGAFHSLIIYGFIVEIIFIKAKRVFPFSGFALSYFLINLTTPNVI
jgi:hypothetical protein